MKKRTILRFHSDGDLWSVVERWGIVNGYNQKQFAGNVRIYQKGAGFLVAPMMLKINNDNQEITLEAWIRVNLLVRIMGLFIVPSEMGIESGGFRLAVPRGIARKAINKLLDQLGQSPIP